MILITSGAYLGPEFTSELGLLPPAFLPVGNKRLFRLQAEELARFGEPVALSLPESFRIPARDKAALSDLGVLTVPVPEGLSLSESILHVLCACPDGAPCQRILHGDTLLYGLPGDLDIYTIDQTSAYYCWAMPGADQDGKPVIAEGLGRTGQSREVLSGYFAFSDRGLLMRSLALSRGSFVAALNAYASNRDLRPARAGRWFDFGHLHTFHQSKAHITTQREFNSLAISPATVTKTSANGAKMEAEAAWFEALPPDLRLNAPRFIRRIPSGYELEYLHLCTLSELMVFGDLPGIVWMQIMEACSRFLGRCRQTPAPAGTRKASLGLYLPKTLARLEAFAASTGLSLDHPWTVNGRQLPGLRQAATLAAEFIPAPDGRDLCLTHGDFCFSNILYDFRRQDILVIDPRGQDASGAPSVFGDIRYDLAKLYHSAASGYDFIKADACRLTRSAPYRLEAELPVSSRMQDIREACLAKVLEPSGTGLNAIKAIAAQLFLSMLPLHADNPGHQMALLATGLGIVFGPDGLLAGGRAETHLAA